MNVAPTLAIDPFDEALHDAEPVVRRRNSTLHAIASLPVEVVPA